MGIDYDNLRKRKFFGQVNFLYEQEAFREKGMTFSEEDFKKSVKERIEKICSNEDDVYYYVFHDRDVWEKNGNLESKPLHAHFVLDFKNPRSWTSVSKELKISRSENLSAVRSMTKSCRYLTHRTEAAMSEGKFQYEMKDVFTNRDYSEIIKGGSVRSISNNERSSDGLMVDEFCLDLGYKIQEQGLLLSEAKNMLYHEFSELSAQKAWDKNRKVFENNRNEFIETQFKKLQKGGRNHVGIYIEGDGEAGKSRLASVLGELNDPELGSHNPSMNKHRLDLGSNYRGNKTIVLDEFDPTCGMNYRELFKLFEPDVVAQLSSRFKDTMLINDLTIITHSLDYLEWVDWWIRYDEKQYDRLLHQLLRRIRYRVKIDVHHGKKKSATVTLYGYTANISSGIANKDDLKLIKKFRLRSYSEQEFERVGKSILQFVRK